MTTIASTPDVPVPPGAEPDQWVAGQRDVYAQVGHVAVSPDLLSCPAVTLVAEQHADGHLGRVDVMLDVAMGRSDAGLSATQARELAGLLSQAADLADKWTARHRNSVDHLMLAQKALRQGIDGILAAMNGITTAIEVSR